MICNSNLDVNVGGMISRFRNGTPISGVVEEGGGLARLQQDIHQVETSLKNWQMEFNSDKCKVIHFGKEIQEIYSKW